MTVLRHPAAFRVAARHMEDASSELRAVLEELRASLDSSALDDEFKAKMVGGLDQWVAQLDRLIPLFKAQTVLEDKAPDGTQEASGREAFGPTKHK